jgi:hypothetical protein
MSIPTTEYDGLHPPYPSGLGMAQSVVPSSVTLPTPGTSGPSVAKPTLPMVAQGRRKA